MRKKIMGNFEKRKVRCQATCCNCAHYIDEIDEDCGGYCLLDIPQEDRDFIIEHIDEYEEDIPERVYELLQVSPVGTWDWYESGRKANCDDCCQFFELHPLYKRVIELDDDSKKEKDV